MLVVVFLGGSWALWGGCLLPLLAPGAGLREVWDYVRVEGAWMIWREMIYDVGGL